MNKLLEISKDLVEFIINSPKMRTFYWQTLNTFIVMVTGFLAVIQPDELNAGVVLVLAGCTAGLHRLTKWINREFLTK